MKIVMICSVCGLEIKGNVIGDNRGIYHEGDCYTISFNTWLDMMEWIMG
jgi:hypothetical protein